MERLSPSLVWSSKRNRNGAKLSLYVMQCGEFTKIGFARDVANRFNNFQTGNPHEMQLLASTPTRFAVQLESRLHAYLGRYHVRGEWFKLPCDVLDGLLGI